MSTQAPKSSIPAAEAPRPDVGPERVAARHLIVLLKQHVKSDAATVRSAKRAVRALQRLGADEARAAQAGLVALRRDARVWLLVYGFARGRAWAAIERDRPQGDAGLAPRLLWAWRAAEEAVGRVTGTLPPLPDALRGHLP